ncbi:MAG: DUF362 domain-containing protein [Deltaproteobacteria bacterium]|nr:DUF362 domain-containing protein [Deltaproteobacteria bacterium]
MDKPVVAIVRYEKPLESVRRAVDLSRGLDALRPGSRVFIKPNIVFWTRAVSFPKWGVITTSRVVEDLVIVLKERGINDITIGEGTVTLTPGDNETIAHAFTSLGYETLRIRYGVKHINVFTRPFETVNLGDGVTLNFNADILHSDFVVDLPVLKTHAQTVVSLGIKNLKGTIDIDSRKRCHAADPVFDLNYMISKLADPMPPIFTLLDGIYTNERGPSFDGRIRRSNILAASSDILSVDKVGAMILGYEPGQVPHLVHAAHARQRTLDLSDVTVVGEALESVAARHEFDFPYDESGSLPRSLAKMGIQGLAYPKYDLSLCTYCSGLNGVVLAAIAQAWAGTPFDDVEVLTGKRMKPSPGKKKTILLGKCMVRANRGHPEINEVIEVKGCPPPPGAIVKALHRAGIMAPKEIFEQIDQVPGLFFSRYAGKPEFEESHFQVN